MSDAFAVPDNLDSIVTDIWTRWSRGSADRRSPFHTPVVASNDEQSNPDQRVMVLRKTDRIAGTLRFHTDVRSRKVVQLGLNRTISILGYDASAKIQLRATGIASVLIDTAEANAAWAATSPSGRRSYLTTLAPGSHSPCATSGLPETLDSTVPTLAQSEAGRANFGLVVVALDTLEWLHLAASGHRRAAFTRTGHDWTGRWLIP